MWYHRNLIMQCAIRLHNQFHYHSAQSVTKDVLKIPLYLFLSFLRELKPRVNMLLVPGLVAPIIGEILFTLINSLEWLLGHMS